MRDMRCVVLGHLKPETRAPVRREFRTSGSDHLLANIAQPELGKHASPPEMVFLDKTSAPKT